MAPAATHTDSEPLSPAQSEASSASADARHKKQRETQVTQLTKDIRELEKAHARNDMLPLYKRLLQKRTELNTILNIRTKYAIAKTLSLYYAQGGK
ncbi:Hypothetical predicted protein, partial [Pelobates cultripes]